MTNNSSDQLDKTELQLQHKADVLIVGGGPIGLVQAWGLKKINPDLKVVVLEKYEEFQRKHTLVMQYKQLEALMRATDSMEDPVLRSLLQQLRKSPNIRTNVLQETFKDLATALGVEIKIQEVKSDNIADQIQKYSPELIIGADGTHSVVNAQLFPEGNRINYEIDYAMQVRLEIDGDADKSLDQTIQFYQRLAHHGLIATEQVGRPDPKTGKTPVTMQIIIPKEDYELLNSLELKPNARNPIKPFDGLELRETPAHLQAFIDSYIYERLKVSGNKISPDSIRISVNELPASKVTETYTCYKNKELNSDVFVSLNGDSALGLSYFKGLNAGLEASAKFLELMRNTVKQGLTDKTGLAKALSDYQLWFTLFADNKVQEVQQYSSYKVRSSMKVIKGVQVTKFMSAYRPEVDKKPLIDAYYHLIARAAPEDMVEFKPFPHRAYDPNIQLGQFDYVPIQYTLKKIGKIFVDFVKPYKSTYQLIDDYKQPMTGAINTGMGLFKFFIGIITLNSKHLTDGAFRMARGIIELVMTPLTYLVKPITRGLITLVSNHNRVEDNDGVKTLIKEGTNILVGQDDHEELSFDKAQKLLGICNDLHRKFTKAVLRGQDTDINVATEQHCIKELTVKSDTGLSGEKVRKYFTLFRDTAHAKTIDDQEVASSEHQEDYGLRV